MPELPEVETIKRGLQMRIRGANLASVDVLEPKTAIFSSAEIKQLYGAKVKSIHRRAKVLIWDFENGFSLLFHLKMTGQVIVDHPDEKRYAGGHPTKSMETSNKLPDRSSRIVFNFNDKMVVYFNDQRKFGWVKLLPTKDVDSEDLLIKIGPDAHELEPSPMRDEINRKIRNSRRTIKAVILDQNLIAGVGNIYADESLHLAKIHPARKASSLTKTDVDRLLEAIKTIMNESIKLGGTSFTNYVNVVGVRGDYLQHARVFRREGQACQVCGAKIIKTRVAGRGTHYCPTCQKPSKGFKP